MIIDKYICLTGLENGINDAPNSAYSKIYETQRALLTRNFLTLINDFNACQQDYREKCKLRLKRLAEIAGNDLSEEDMADLAEKGRIQSNILTNVDPKMLEDIEIRRNDIFNLEKGILELHEMFQDITILLESQVKKAHIINLINNYPFHKGEMIDRIDHHVEMANEKVGAAVKDTKTALKYQAAYRKKKLMMLSAVVIIVIIMGLIVYGKLF